MNSNVLRPTWNSNSRTNALGVSGARTTVFHGNLRSLLACQSTLDVDLYTPSHSARIDHDVDGHFLCCHSPSMVSSPSASCICRDFSLDSHQSSRRSFLSPCKSACQMILCHARFNVLPFPNPAIFYGYLCMHSIARLRNAIGYDRPTESRPAENWAE